MLADVIAYPFGLAARRPVATLAFFAFWLVVLFAVDAGFAELGHNVFSSDPFASDAGRLYNVVTSLFSTFVAAFPMAFALHDANLRVRGPSFRDGVALLALGIWFGIAVILPLVIVGVLIVGGLSALAPEGLREAIAAAVAGVCIIVAVYIALRLSFAGPRTLIDERIHLFRTWSLTRGKVWSILAISLVAAIVAVVLVIVTWIPQMLVSAPNLYAWTDALEPAAAITIVSSELGYLLATAYFSAAQGCLYSKLTGGDA